MNLGRVFGLSTIVMFTWAWVFGTIFVASYFAFSLFPALTRTETSLYFQANDNGVTYWPNSSRYRKQQLSHLSDRSYLYVSECQVLPFSARPDCDATNNWYRIDPNDVGCTDVASCTKTEYRVPKDLEAALVSGAIPLAGHKITLKDPNAVSLSDPTTWREKGEWPVFFSVLFLSLKLGRSAGEFLFTAYEKK